MKLLHLWSGLRFALIIVKPDTVIPCISGDSACIGKVDSPGLEGVKFETSSGR